MKQEAAPQEVSLHLRGKEPRHAGSRLGPLLCWAVVFADVGTSIYYVPGILYGTVGNLAGFFTRTTTINRPETLLALLNTWHRRRRLLADLSTDCKSRKWLSAYGRSFIRMISSSRLKIYHSLKRSIRIAYGM